jgi:hypothetical protein
VYLLNKSYHIVKSTPHVLAIAQKPKAITILC